MIMEFGIDNLFVILAVIFAFVGGYIAKYKRRNRAITSPDASVLLSYYSEGVTLVNAYNGKLKNGLDYSTFVAKDNNIVPGNPDFSIIYRVILPFATTIHLLGIPKKTGAISLNPANSNSIMERVNLEGDYIDIFDLFAEVGMQSDTRYVLDPKAMVFTIDFCQSHNWEIVGNELYFVVTNNMKQDPNDKTGALEDVIPFIEEIRPAVERPLTPHELKILSPHGKDYRTNLKCPLCADVLINEQTYYHCPQGHGVLLSGGLLQELVDGKLVPKLKNNNPQEFSHELSCPSCSNRMNKVNYAGGKMIIDSCSNCAYRWLDAGEYTK